MQPHVECKHTTRTLALRLTQAPVAACLGQAWHRDCFAYGLCTFFFSSREIDEDWTLKETMGPELSDNISLVMGPDPSLVDTNSIDGACPGNGKILE